MVVKNLGISPDLLILPGETIADILVEREITQKELAQRAGVSEAFLSDVIHGKKDISKGLAMGLEYALGVPKSFWLNLQANYDSEVLSLQEESSVQEDEKEVLTSLREMVDYLKKESMVLDGLSQTETIIKLRNLFHVSSLASLSGLVDLRDLKKTDKADVDSDVLGAWLCMCNLKDSEKKAAVGFEPTTIENLIFELKELMFENSSILQNRLKTLLAEYGIEFSVVRCFKGAPVRGLVTRKRDGAYRMVLAPKDSFAYSFWDSLFHALGHIVNGDISKPGTFIDFQEPINERKEKAADFFANQKLLDSASYEKFLGEEAFSYGDIKRNMLSLREFLILLL